MVSHPKNKLSEKEVISARIFLSPVSARESGEGQKRKEVKSRFIIIIIGNHFGFRVVKREINPQPRMFIKYSPLLGGKFFLVSLHIVLRNRRLWQPRWKWKETERGKMKLSEPSHSARETL